MAIDYLRCTLYYVLRITCYTNYTISADGTLGDGQTIEPFKSFTLTIQENVESEFITNLLKADTALDEMGYNITSDESGNIKISNKTDQ